ncbi:MAG: RNA polymerase sigma factor [Pseudomonadota bacterium]|nr:RNA polymerase sigma factor [Pseudomonadota bacterium]
MQPHLGSLFAFAWRLSGNREDAEDLVQDVVAKLYPRLEELESVDQLRPWLNRVLYRQFVDSVRRRGRQADRPFSDFGVRDNPSDWLDTVESDDGSPEWAVDRDRIGPLLDKAMEQLSPDQRTLLLLHDVDGWCQDDLAQVLDIAVGTVKSRLHRSRAMLKKYLQQTMEPEGSFQRPDK